jgi:uncharacterized protein YndB with AHSA1/START domain
MEQKQKQNNGTIKKKVLIKASPEIVFQALTVAHDLARWFCDRALSNPCEGGELTAFWKTGKSSQKGKAIFKRVIPGSQIQLVWVDDGEGFVREDAHHVLTFSIQVKRGTSEVTMSDEDDPLSDEETFAFIDYGWNSVLLELKDYCERKERSTKRGATPELEE